MLLRALEVSGAGGGGGAGGLGRRAATSLLAHFQLRLGKLSCCSQVAREIGLPPHQASVAGAVFTVNSQERR